MSNQKPGGLFGWFLVSRFWFLVEKQVFTAETTRNKKPETRNRSHQFVRIYMIVLVQQGLSGHFVHVSGHELDV